MRNFIVIIKLGDTELQCRVEAEDLRRAADKAVNKLPTLDADNPARMAYEAYVREKGYCGEFKVEVREVAPNPPAREGRFKIEPSKKKDGWWVVTDIDSLVVITFKEHCFHETQRIVPLTDQIVDPLTSATALTEMAEWLRDKHYDKIF